MQPGDLLRIHGEHDVDWFGEVAEATEDGAEVFLLEREPTSLLWRLSDTTTRIHSISVREHVALARPLTRSVVKRGWRQLGFVVDIYNFARVEDFDAGRAHLNPDHMDEDDEEGADEADDYDYTDGFVVPDDVADEPFTFADPSALDPAAAAWVRETHDAVRKYNHWHPADRSGQNIKRFVDQLATRAALDANQRRWGPDMDCRRPPVR
jgi:hypothetical protein